MIKILILSTLLNGDISPQTGDLSPFTPVEARKRGKGNKKRRRGGNGLR